MTRHLRKPAAFNSYRRRCRAWAGNRLRSFLRRTTGRYGAALPAHALPKGG